MPVQGDPTPREPGRRLLRWIAVFKFGKAILLTCVALGAWELIDRDVAAQAKQWSSFATVYDLDAAHRLIVALADLTPGRLEALGAIALAYAVLFSIEGVGLWRAKRWAEYITVLSTCSLAPFEIYELFERLTPQRITALAINVVVVAYLIFRLRRGARRRDNPLANGGPAR